MDSKRELERRRIVGEGNTLLEVLGACLPPADCDFLSRYIRPNEDTAFGRAHGFSEIQSYEDFVQHVPLQNYDAFRPWVERAADGESEVLTAENPVGFEITSGTSCSSKWIPITPGYQWELASALAVWMKEWQRRYPGVFDGPAYWSVSPRLGQNERTRSGLPLGFSNDAAYFPPDVQHGLSKWLVAPEGGGEDIFSDTAKLLQGTPDLRAVSVWSPVFFLKLDEALGTNETWSEIWPELRVVSCWADAQASLWEKRVKERLGERVSFEPKGLLATEGVTTIPMEGGNQIAKGVHFHEFVPTENGSRQEVVLTTAGGLYRYRTGDLVEMGEDGHVVFVGRTGESSDLVGEKLDSVQIRDAFQAAGDSGFVRVQNSGYSIFAHSPEHILKLLRRNRHFATALDTGQLDRCQFFQLSDDWEIRAAEYLAIKRGGREGDVKLPLLEKGELAELWET